MHLSVCQSCQYGTIKDNSSHCQREQVYSHLSNCIRKKALEEYIERQRLVEVDGERVT